MLFHLENKQRPWEEQHPPPLQSVISLCYLLGNFWKLQVSCTRCEAGFRVKDAGTWRGARPLTICKWRLIHSLANLNLGLLVLGVLICYHTNALILFESDLTSLVISLSRQSPFALNVLSIAVFIYSGFPEWKRKMARKLPAIKETWARSLSQEDPLEKGMATHSCIVAWRISWTEEPGRQQSMGLQRVGYDWVANT